MEVELKLTLDPGQVKTLRHLPLIRQHAVEPPHELEMTSTYFDTPDLDIRQSGAGLRVRTVDGMFIQTLKAGGKAAGGLHQRNEWECRIDEPVPDLDALRRVVDAHSKWAKMLRRPAFASRLRPVFTMRVTRLIWLLRLTSGDEIELALDQGAMILGNNEVRISEIELELKSGNPESLFHFALALHGEVPLRVSNISKADRGYALYAPQPLTAVKAVPIQLSGKMTIEQGFSAIIAACLVHAQANEEGVIQGDQESVHQMRVGLRRLRSAMKLFQDVLPIPADLISEVRWLATELGDARDWDVLTDATLEKISAECAGLSAVEELRSATQDIALHMREKAAQAILSPRYAQLLLQLSGWLAGSHWRDGLSRQEQAKYMAPLSRFSQKILAHDQNMLLKRGKRLAEADPEKRHRVRIAAKKTRYATEFFQSLLGPRKVRPYVSALSNLQDELGWLNDAAVAERLLRDLENPEAGYPELSGSAGFVRGYLTARAAQDGPRLSKLWKDFSHIKPPSLK